MFGRKVTILIIISLILAFLPSTAGIAGTTWSPAGRTPVQDTAQTRVVTFADLGYASDETYKGVLASRDYAVRWPDAWLVQPGNILRLIFSHSPILHPRSTLVVDWNGTRLASTLLTPENVDRGVLEVPIPEDLILTGYNRLHIEFYMGIDDDDFCVDEDNPGLWATVHSGSNLTLAYSDKLPELDLSLYPQPLVDNSQLVDNTVTFILPQSPSPEELSAAATISAGLGKLAAWHMVTIQAGEPVGSVRAGDLIIIGTPTRNRLINPANIPFLQTVNGNLAFTDAGGSNLPEEAGILWESISPGDPVSVALYVTGTNDEAVLKAARALASTSTIGRLSGSMGLILSVPDPLLTGPGEKKSFTLEELGYPDMQARGTREQNITYVLSLDNAWNNESEVLLDLHFAHSNVIHNRRSSVTVEVNGTAAGSIALNPDNAVDAHTAFHLPSRLFNVGNNTITISANLRLPDDVEDDWDCLDDHSLDSWLVVYADSAITLPSESSGTFITLADFPSGYVGNASLSDLAFIVPPAASVDLATAVLRIAEGLGDASTGDNFQPAAAAAGDIEEAASKYRYLYLVGRPSQNTAISRFNDRLPMPFLAGTDEPEEVEGVARVIASGASKGYIEAFPGDMGTPNVVIAGNSDEGILWAADVLQNPSRFSRLSGDLAVLDGPSSIVSAEVKYKASSRFTASEEVDVPEPGLNLAGTAIRPALWVAYAAGGVLLLALLIMLIYSVVDLQNKQKARSHHESPSA